jgi:hypothetical protein
VDRVALIVVGCGIAIGLLGGYEIRSGRALTRSGDIKRADNPTMYWIVVVTMVTVGVFAIGVGLWRLIFGISGA